MIDERDRPLFDERVYTAVMLGHKKLTLLCIMLRMDPWVLAMNQEQGVSASRVIDKALQRLRKARKIAYCGAVTGWAVLK